MMKTFKIGELLQNSERDDGCWYISIPYNVDDVHQVKLIDIVFHSKYNGNHNMVMTSTNFLSIYYVVC